MDVKKLPKGSGVPILMASLLLFLACGGCTSPRTIARSALEAPNHHIKIPRVFEQLGAVLATNFPSEQINVGPPPAMLDLMVMEPGDYGAKLNSTITVHHPQRHGDTNRFDFNFTFNLSHFSPKSKPETKDIRGTIFLLHGYGLNKETMVPWGLVLAESGYRVVLVDLRGHGHSTGDRIYFGGVERTDLVQCLDTLRQRHVCEGPVGALGISYGAVLALQWAAIDPRVQSVAAISPYPDPDTAVDRYLKTFAPNLTWRTDRKAAALVASHLAEFPDLATETAIRQIRHPILFVRGENDEVCLKEDLSRFQAAAPPGSEVEEVPLANHLVAGMCITQLREPVTKWFHRQLIPP
ncbi:MAG TPA: alpha/beta fold hydrolase [Candidatus Limnocylindrales bacterium]|nr:alpha/beta fold hydrolase [Candidatus Limnocylindrales bacterium]